MKDARCDIDASAFPITDTGKVSGDEWFVFYGQTQSPDGAVVYHDRAKEDRQYISVDASRLDGRVRKIVFVLTINEAVEQALHFGMIEDAYVRILDDATGREIASYRVDEYYSNVTSMTIGEMYLHNGEWKFNPVGNGVSMDLAGQCRVYGVEIC